MPEDEKKIAADVGEMYRQGYENRATNNNNKEERVILYWELKPKTINKS